MGSMDGVIYNVFGKRAVLDALVSLWSLRRFHKGPVLLSATDSVSLSLARNRLAEEQRLHPFQVMDNRNAMPTTSRTWRARCWLFKTQLPLLTPFDRTLYLDADTVVVGKIDELWPESGEWVFSSNGGRRSKDKITQRHVTNYETMFPELVARTRRKGHMAINNGVLAWSGNGGPWRDEWERIAYAHQTYENDEAAAQLIYTDARHRMVDTRFNANPHYGIKANGDDVRIWHGQARRFTRNQLGRQIWWAALGECIRDNVCGIGRKMSLESLLD